MPKDRIRELLADLRKETQSAGLDQETRETLEQLDADIHRLLGPDESPHGGEELAARAREMEAQFAASHPVVETTLRAIVDTLVKIGI